jgi:hypothetical protein
MSQYEIVYTTLYPEPAGVKFLFEAPVSWIKPAGLKPRFQIAVT